MATRESQQERVVAVFVSLGMKACWLGTHVGFAAETAERAMDIFRTAPQKCLKEMQQQDDVFMRIEANGMYDTEELEQLKLNAYNKYKALGFTMLCKEPKVK